MTKPERFMKVILEAKKQAGEVLWYGFECLKLSVGEPCCWYKIDFLAQFADGSMHAIETKGPFIREDSLIKFKAAKKQYPCLQFELHQLTKEGWQQLI